jgi:hypothetical protein
VTLYKDSKVIFFHNYASESTNLQELFTELVQK